VDAVEVDAVELVLKIVLKLLTISIKFNKMGTIYNIFTNKRHDFDRVVL
jgi:hypothetical protein